MRPRPLRLRAPAERAGPSHVPARGVHSSRRRAAPDAATGAPDGGGGSVAARMREVMRRVAQPVAVAVTATPSGPRGATLTSLTSLSLHPHPLVAFSLRLPSRLADLLRPASPTLRLPPLPTLPLLGRPPASLPLPGRTRPRLTVSLLGRECEDVAEALARPGAGQARVFERRFEAWPAVWAGGGGHGVEVAGAGESEGEGEGEGENDSELVDSQHAPPPPVAVGAVGSLHCEVLSSLALADLGGAGGAGGAAAGATGSELFVCRVLDVAPGEGAASLLHCDRRYTAPER